jgi:hypothetical protein
MGRPDTTTARSASIRPPDPERLPHPVGERGTRSLATLVRRHKDGVNADPIGRPLAGGQRPARSRASGEVSRSGVLISDQAGQSGPLAASPQPDRAGRIWWWRHPAFAVGVPLLVGLVHVALVAPHYFVGSFDDDAGYILAAKALLAGHGLTWLMPTGTTVAGAYPPGYSALLAPLLWIWPHTYVPLRLLSVACYAAIFPLTWMYLGRRRVGDGVRIVTLLILALGPPLATFGSMVMAETPYLVLLLVLLILVDRWDAQARVFTLNGVAVIVAAAGLVWLKEAGIGAVAGLCVWLLLPWGRHRPSWRKSAAVAGSVIALLIPVAAARVIAGVPVAGSRYSQELGAYYSGGLVGRIVHVAPHGLWQMLSTALPATLLPYLSPLPIHGHAPDVWKVLSWLVSVLVVVGAIVWARRHRDAALPIVAVYLLETLFWPEVNERRVILVLPILVAWYVLGAQAAGLALWSWVQRRRWRWRPSATVGVAGAAVLAGALVLAPLSVQLPRDYLVNLGQNTSHFAGSAYVRILTQLGQPSDVVETDYLSSTALFTGHDTRELAFTDTVNSCNLSVIRSALAQDHAGFLLLGNVNKPDVLDRPCLLQVASGSTWAVPLLHTSRDNASVFELIGPGTGHPDLQNLTASATRTQSTADPSIAEWVWSSPRYLSQISVSQAGQVGATTSVDVQIRQVDGAWQTIAAAPSAVGEGKGATPYLLATLPAGILATAVRVVVSSTAPATAATTPVDLAALGPVGAR